MKMSADAAADTHSETSLSFSCYVLEQDRKHPVPRKGHVQPHVQDERASQEFGFSSGVLRRQQYSADISTGQGKQSFSAIPEKDVAEKKHNTSPGFGKKIINSFACKNCRAVTAIEPTQCVVERASR